jgi:anti-sigma factor RsiW
VSAHLDDALSALADGELSADEEARARAHLAECEGCRLELAAVERVRSMVRSLPVLDRPAVRRRPPWPAAVAAAVAAVALFVSTEPGPGRPVAPQVSPVDPLQLLVAPADASASAPVPFTGLARLRWVEGGQQAVVPVDADGWATLRSGAPLVPVELKYDLLRGPEREVAGRAAVTMEVWAGEELRERVALDAATGLVLHREQLDDRGRPVRVVTVERLEMPSSSAVADAGKPVPVDRLPDRYRLPDTLAGGYRHVAAYQQGELVHVLYSDGLHGLSVFVQPGRPVEEGRPVQVGRWEARHVGWPGGDALTWEAAGLAYTVVGDGARRDVVAAAASLGGPPRLSPVERVARWGRGLAELVVG